MALDVYGILGWLVYPLERTCDSKGPRGVGWSCPWGLGAWLHQSLYVSWRNQFWLHEWLFSSGDAWFATGDVLWLWGFAQWAGQSDREVLCHSKNDGDLLSGIPTAGTAYQRVFTRANLAIGSQDQSFWESGQFGSGRDQPLSGKDGRVGANHRLSPIWDRPWVGCGRRKTAHHWWSRSGTNLPGWSTCSNTIPNRDRWRSFYQRKKESGYEFKNLAWEYGPCQLWSQALSW